MAQTQHLSFSYYYNFSPAENLRNILILRGKILEIGKNFCIQIQFHPLGPVTLKSYFKFFVSVLPKVLLIIKMKL